MACGLDISKIVLDTFHVHIGGNMYTVGAPNRSSALRAGLYEYLDVVHWDSDTQVWFYCTDIATLLSTLPDSITVLAKLAGQDRDEDVDDDCRLLH